MDIDPALLLIIIFLLAPLIERLFKAGRQQPPPPPPPQQRPQHRTPPQHRPRPELQRPAPRPSAEQEGGDRAPSAADMVPDDLWAILTGEQRAPRPPAEPPRRELPGPAPAEPGRQPGMPSRTPTPAPTTRRPEPAAQRPRPFEDTPSAPERRPPVVSKRPLPAGYDMRGELPPDEEDVFRRPPPPERAPVEGYVREIPVHAPPDVVSLEELVIDDVKRHDSFHERLAALPRAAGVRRAKRHELALRFRAQDEIRRAIVMSEVLGRPKGLD